MQYSYYCYHLLLLLLCVCLYILICSCLNTYLHSDLIVKSFHINAFLYYHFYILNNDLDFQHGLRHSELTAFIVYMHDD